ncbi:HAD-IA family hydrolase [Hypericibacter sp.]|uniref:HAD-IA family hydrolase n=1 Tax=Hypericibacter sp. TaxID=2705401 RepID=UPI003D6D8BB0
MALRDFKVLTFDVVGTLIDFERGIVDYVREVSGADPSRLADDAILESYRRSRNFAGRDHYPDDLVRGYAAMAQELGLPTGPRLGEGLRDSVRRWPAFPDSVAALKRLRRRYRLVAMTNAQRWALAHMEKTLEGPFHDTVTVDDARAEKPDPQFFAFARGRLSAAGYRLEDNLHVAQSQYHDIGVARRLGYTVCWIERRRGLKGFGGTQEVPELTKPDYHFATLAALADAVEAETP